MESVTSTRLQQDLCLDGGYPFRNNSPGLPPGQAGKLESLTGNSPSFILTRAGTNQGVVEDFSHLLSLCINTHLQPRHLLTTFPAGCFLLSALPLPSLAPPHLPPFLSSPAPLSCPPGTSSHSWQAFEYPQISTSPASSERTEMQAGCAGSSLDPVRVEVLSKNLGPRPTAA